MSAASLALPGARARRRNSRLGDLIRWAFGVATVVTNLGKAKFAEQNTVGTTGKYVPGGGTAEPPKFLALGVGAEEAAREAKATDTALSNEKETRAEGTMSTVTTTVTNDTFQVTGSQTATAERKVNEAAVFDKSSGGNMAYSATFNPDNLNNGDSITFTWKIKQS